MLYQQGDWKALAKRPTTNEFRRDVEAMGYRARLPAPGRRTRPASTPRSPSCASTPRSGTKDVEMWYAAKALFLNDRPADALAVLAKKSTYRTDMRFELLAARGRYRETFAAADAVKADDPEKPLIEVLRARTLYQLGETDKARGDLHPPGSGHKGRERDAVAGSARRGGAATWPARPGAGACARCWRPARARRGCRCWARSSPVRATRPAALVDLICAARAAIRPRR